MWTYRETDDDDLLPNLYHCVQTYSLWLCITLQSLKQFAREMCLAYLELPVLCICQFKSQSHKKCERSSRHKLVT